MADKTDKSFKRLFKVLVRTVHLVGVAGLFGGAMFQVMTPAYFYLAVVSGIILMGMEAHSGWIWFVQIRGVSVLFKLLLMVPVHFYPDAAVPLMIVMIVISGFTTHAPSWIRYYSLKHRQVVLSEDDILG